MVSNNIKLQVFQLLTKSGFNLGYGMGDDVTKGYNKLTCCAYQEVGDSDSGKVTEGQGPSLAQQYRYKFSKRGRCVCVGGGGGGGLTGP